MQKLSSELEDLLALDKYDEEIALASAKIFWAEVALSNSLVAKCVHELDVAKSNLAKAEKKFAECEEKKGSIGTLDDIRAAQEEMQADLAAAIAEITECQERVRAAAREEGMKKLAVDKITSNIKELNSRMASCNAQVRTHPFFPMGSHLSHICVIASLCILGQEN